MNYTTERLRAEELLHILSLSNHATAIYTTEDIIIETANEKMIAAWQKDDSVIGMRIEDALPELKDQPFFNILKNVWRTGTTYEAKGVAADIETNGRMLRYYFDFEYRAIKKPDGSMYCILHTSRDVTDAVQKEQVIRITESELTKLNRDLARANRDMSESNRELHQLNENLFMAQKDLSVMYAKLLASEEKFRSVVEQLPVAVNVLHSRELIIELVNEKFIELWAKPVTPDEVIGKTILEVNPEFTGQPFMQHLNDVYTTGITYINDNEKGTVVRHGKRETGSYTVIFHPLKNDAGEVYGILQVAADNTKEMLAKQQIQDLNEELAATNEELAAGNEELRAVNEELQQSQENLVEANSQLVESEKRFRSLAEGTNVYIGVSDETGNAVYFNSKWTETTGISNEDLLRYGWADALHPEDRDRFVSLYNAAVSDKISFTSEFRILDKYGHYLWLLVQGIPRLHPDGSFAGFIGSYIDITERKQDEQRKNDFIGMVSHELKTPLTSLNGYIEIVKFDLKNNENHTGANLLDKAGRQVMKMTTMINGFLNVSRLESGKLQIEKQRFDMAKLMEETKEETVGLYNNHRFIFHPLQETFVDADRDKIGHVLNNFISNAVKYSPYHSTIYIACTTANGNVQVSVTDEGIGIAPHHQDKLFERYYRVDNKTTHAVAGFGIGLYLCSEIIHRNGGAIWFESEPGKGSAFYFSLPVINSTD